jgi:hypothetical protein
MPAVADLNSVFIACANLREAEIALNALQAFRALPSSPPEDEPPNLSVSGLSMRIEATLRVTRLPELPMCILRALVGARPNLWVSYDPTLVAAVESITGKEDARRRSAAALRHLSSLMKEQLPASDLVGFHKSIEVLASRSRTGGEYSYRLTVDGRTAVGRFLASAS